MCGPLAATRWNQDVHAQNVGTFVLDTKGVGFQHFPEPVVCGPELLFPGTHNGIEASGCRLHEIDGPANMSNLVFPRHIGIRLGISEQLISGGGERLKPPGATIVTMECCHDNLFCELFGNVSEYVAQT
jgi:hypothetical protein